MTSTRKEACGDTTTMTPTDVVGFWREAGADTWFKRDDEFDADFSRRFGGAHHAAARGECESRLETAEGALALQILLEQFPRNVFRGSAHSYATDGLARHYAHRAVDAGLDQQIEGPMRAFLYMPFEHSESLADQNRAVTLVEALGDDGFTRFAELHRDLMPRALPAVVQRFGRFPHRNRALGRESIQDELEYLASGGFAG